MRAPPERREGARQGAPSIPSHNSSTPQFRPATPRLQYLAERLHQLGPRALHEFVVELAAAYGCDVIDRLEGYSRIDPHLLHALGGDRFPARPLRRVA